MNEGGKLLVDRPVRARRARGTSSSTTRSGRRRRTRSARRNQTPGRATRTTRRARTTTACIGVERLPAVLARRVPADHAAATRRGGRTLLKSAAARHARVHAQRRRTRPQNQDNLVLVPDDVEHPAARRRTRSSRATRRSRSTGRRPSTRRTAATTRTRSAANSSLPAADADGRPDRQTTGRRCSSSSPTTPSRTSTTCSSRRTPSARTTGRRCPT